MPVVRRRPVAPLISEESDLRHLRTAIHPTMMVELASNSQNGSVMTSLRVAQRTEKIQIKIAKKLRRCDLNAFVFDDFLLTNENFVHHSEQ